MSPADCSSTRGGSKFVHAPIRSLHMAKLQAVSVPIAYGSCAPMAGTDRRTDGSLYRSMTPPPYVGDIIKACTHPYSKIPELCNTDKHLQAYNIV